MVADLLADRWSLGRPRKRFRGLIVEGRARGPWPEAPGVGFDFGGPARGGEAGDMDSDIEGSVRPPVRGREPRVAILWPQTYMNEAGRSVGPARGALKLPLGRVLVVHDEIDIPFGDVRPRLGGGLAGHNGLKSIARELGARDFPRVRVGVGRPSSSDPEIVSAHVLGCFREGPEEVAGLVAHAADRVQAIVLGEEAL
jgi:peptidyl-tRNA hydrolase, PTH1 family